MYQTIISICHLICLFPWTYSQGFTWTFVSLSSVIGLQGSSDGKESACNAWDLGSIPGSGRPLEKVKATHSSILAWRIRWTEEPGGLQSMGLQWVRHHWMTNMFTYFQCCNNIFKITTCFLTVQLSHSVVADSWRPHGLQHARLPCPSPTPRAHSNSCQSSQWCHTTISSSVVPFSFCLQSLPAPGSFQMSQFFTSDDQSIGVSASASVLPMRIQDWHPLGWTGWISLQSKGLSRVFSNTTVQKHQYFGFQLSL